MKQRSNVGIVARREVSTRIRSKSFLVGTAITLALVALGIVVPTFFDGDDRVTYEVGIVGDAPTGFVEQLEALAATDDHTELETVPSLTATEAEQLLRDGALDVAVDGRQLLVFDEIGGTLQQWVGQSLAQATLVDSLGDAGLSTDDAIAALAEGSDLEVVDLDDGDDERDTVLAMVAAIALFVSVQIGGNGLLSSSIEEKTSRVMEVVLGSVSPRQLLTGKVLGMLVLTMAQFTSYVAVALGLNAVVDAFELPDAAVGTAVVALVMLLVGFVLYAAFFALAGAMASGIEDAQSTMGPMMVFMMIGYIGVFVFVLPSPESVGATVLGYLPITAPFAVPSLYAVGTFGALETILSVVGVAAFAAVALRVAGRLYSAAVLAGGTLSWREVFMAEPLDGRS